MSRIQLYGFGNAIVDILTKVTDQEFDAFAFDKGTMRLVTPEEQAQTISAFQGKDLRLVSGGSVANSVFVFAQLGGKAAFSGVVGDDRYGLHYASELDQNCILSDAIVHKGQTTGTCLVVITPDSERTMRTSLGCSGMISKEHYNHELGSQADWVFLEGYIFANPDQSKSLLDHLEAEAEQTKIQLALTLSEAWVVETFRARVEQMLPHVSLLFANEVEAKAISGKSDREAAFHWLCEKIPSVCMTVGSDGVYVQHDGVKAQVSSVPSKLVDLTGAGDVFAGSYLFGLCNGLSAERAGRAACFMAHKVIEKEGARLTGDVKGLWEEAIRA